MSSFPTKKTTFVQEDHHQTDVCFNIFRVIRKRFLIRRESTTRRTHLDCILLMVCAELGGNLGPPVVAFASISCMTRAFERVRVAAEPPPSSLIFFCNFFQKPPRQREDEKQISLLLLKNISCSNPAFEEEDQRILRILNADLRVLLLVVVHVVAVAADS